MACAVASLTVGGVDADVVAWSSSCNSTLTLITIVLTVPLSRVLPVTAHGVLVITPVLTLVLLQGDLHYRLRQRCEKPAGTGQRHSTVSGATTSSRTGQLPPSGGC